MENLEDTLSINHNWLNCHNIEKVWQLLQREGAEAAAAIEDIRFEEPQSTSTGVLSVKSRNMDASLAAWALPMNLSMFMHHLSLQRNSIMSILAVAGSAWQGLKISIELLWTTSQGYLFAWRVGQACAAQHGSQLWDGLLGSCRNDCFHRGP